MGPSPHSVRWGSDRSGRDAAGDLGADRGATALERRALAVWPLQKVVGLTDY